MGNSEEIRTGETDRTGENPKIYYKDETIDLDFVIPSANVRVKVQELSKDIKTDSVQQKAMKTIMELAKRADIQDIEKKKQSEIMKLLLSEGIMTEETLLELTNPRPDPDVTLKNAKTTIKMFKMIVKPPEDNKECLKEFNKAETSAFWLNQNIVNIEDSIQFFRSENRI